jgi:hypothetical protein
MVGAATQSWYYRLSPTPSSTDMVSGLRDPERVTMAFAFQAWLPFAVRGQWSSPGRRLCCGAKKRPYQRTRGFLVVSVCFKLPACGIAVFRAAHCLILTAPAHFSVLR